MNPTIKKILSAVLKRTVPSPEERSKVYSLSKTLRERVLESARGAELEIKVNVEGSIAKNTWLRESPELDIFMYVPPSVPKEELGSTYLDLAKRALSGREQIERFAEHPYLEAIVDGVRVNIVPCYLVKRGEWKSATDRTPFHTRYVKPLLNEKLANQIRLLKGFMKGIGVYGAEMKVGGFSGYLCELLILFYGSFLQTIEATCEWKRRTEIDIESYYEGRLDELQGLFPESFVIVDPVDERRNVASAVREERLSELIAASRAFLDKPNIRFFFPDETKPMTAQKLIQTMKTRGSTIIFVCSGSVNVVPDVLWGQLYKSQRSLKRLAKRNDFRVIRDAVFSDEKKLNIFLLEVENPSLPALKKHLGPPLDRKMECRRFLKRHLDSPNVLSGPRIQEERWVVDLKRKHSTLLELLQATLKDGGQQVGVAKQISIAFVNDLRILVGEEILPTYSNPLNKDFAIFLTEYVAGTPKWLIS